MTLVSVIVPSYNHAAFLEQRLESIYNQSFRDFEVIILDDCSKDNSREIIEKYRSHPNTAHIIFNEKNSASTFVQWEKGVSLAKGKFIWIAESDDYCELNFLEVAVSHLSDEYDLFYAKTTRVDETGNLMQNQYRWYEDISPTRWKHDFENDAKAEVRDVLFKKCVINNASAVVFRKEPRILEYLAEIRGMRYAGDWFFWILYLLDSRRLCYSTATVNYFRTHPSVTRMDPLVKRNPEMFRIFRFILGHPLTKGKRAELAWYLFSKHLYKGNKRQLGVNIPLAFKTIFVSPVFFRVWFRYYFQ